MKRRQFLEAVGVTVTVGAIAGCTGDSPQGGQRETQQQTELKQSKAIDVTNSDTWDDSAPLITVGGDLDSVTYDVRISHDKLPPVDFSGQAVNYYQVPASAEFVAVVVIKTDDMLGPEGFVTADIQKGGYYYAIGETTDPDDPIWLETDFTKSQ